MSLSRLQKWPRTLFMRLTLIMLAGVIAGQGLSFWLTMYERDKATTTVMAGYVEREVASSVALLDRLTPAGHPGWLPRLARRTYGFILGPGESDAPPNAEVSVPISVAIEQGFVSRYAVSGSAIPDNRKQLGGICSLATALP